MSDSGALLGRVVAGKFMIEELVGSGAMGEVFRARHVVLDTVIALKIMRAAVAKDPMFKERFYREAKAASRLDHPNSVRVLDFGVEVDGLVYLAMEFLHGRDLLSVLRDEWPLPDERIVDIAAQTLAAVSVAHDLGIVHRDLKPENIMVSVGADDDGARPYHVKVCDFGIAKLNDPRGFQSEAGKPALTSSGTLIGTPEYMSPEQARGDPLDARSDLYSIGIILYQLLVGRVPFTAENALGVVLRQVTDQPVPPSKVRPGVNPRLEAICLRALQKSRDERYQSARDMRRDLKGVFAYRPMSSPDESGALVPPAAPSAIDASSAPTLVQPDEPDRVLQSGKTLPLAQNGALRVKAAEVDFSPKETSDGTELTVPVSSAHRYLGAMVVVGVLALLVGAAAVLLPSKSDGSSAGTTAAANGAASVASAAGSVPPAVSADGTSVPVTAPPLAAGSPPVAKGKSPSGIVGKHGTTSSAPSSGTTSSARAGTPPPVVASASSPTPPVEPGPPAAPFNPNGAFVALGASSSSGVSESVLRQKMAAMVPVLSNCYRTGLRAAGAPVGGSVQIHMSIDPQGGIMAVVAAPKIPAFAGCVQGAFAGQKIPTSALEEPSAGATAAQWLDLHP